MQKKRMLKWLESWDKWNVNNLWTIQYLQVPFSYLEFLFSVQIGVGILYEQDIIESKIDDTKAL